MGARVKLAPPLESLLRSDMERAIEEANLGDFCTQIARLCLIRRWAQADIAAQLDCDRSTISKHMPGILERVAAAAQKLGMGQAAGIV